MHGFLGGKTAWGLDLEWGLGLRVEVQVAYLGEELIPLHLHDLVDICGVECFLLSIGVKRLRAVDGAVEQEACIEGLQELQDVMPNLGRQKRPIIVSKETYYSVQELQDVMPNLAVRPDSFLPLLLRAWAQWLIT